MNKTHISEDFHIIRTPKGVLLANSKKPYLKNGSIYYDTNHTVKSILQLPRNIYFSNLEHRYQLINDFCAMSCGFDCLIRRNKSSKEMSKQLFISPRTIEKHIENIKHKLNVKSKYDIFNIIFET